MEGQKELKQFEIFYTIQGGDYFFTASQKVKSDLGEEKLANAFQQFLAKQFPIDFIKITLIRQLAISKREAMKHNEYTT
jgi:hypothetical protein